MTNPNHQEPNFRQLDSVEIRSTTVEAFADQVDISGAAFLAEILERIAKLKCTDTSILQEAIEELKSSEASELSSLN